MTDTDQRIAALEAEVVELRRHFTSDVTDRGAVLSKLDALVPALEKRLTLWDSLFEKVLTNINNSEGIGELRQEGLLPKFNMLFVRLQGLEKPVH